MKAETIALIFMDDSQDNFFIENPPNGPPANWIGGYASIAHVEYVDVIERGSRLTSWSNPNVSSE